MSHGVQTEKPNVPSSTALWAALIFVGLLIAAINFVQAESKGEGHGGHEVTTEHHEAGTGHDAAGGHEGHEANVEAGHEAATPEATYNNAHGEHQDKPEAAPAHEEAHH